MAAVLRICEFGLLPGLGIRGQPRLWTAAGLLRGRVVPRSPNCQEMVCSVRFHVCNMVRPMVSRQNTFWEKFRRGSGSALAVEDIGCDPEGDFGAALVGDDADGGFVADFGIVSLLFAAEAHSGDLLAVASPGGERDVEVGAHAGGLELHLRVFGTDAASPVLARLPELDGPFGDVESRVIGGADEGAEAGGLPLWLGRRGLGRLGHKDRRGKARGVDLWFLHGMWVLAARGRRVHRYKVREAEESRGNSFWGKFRGARTKGRGCPVLVRQPLLWVWRSFSLPIHSPPGFLIEPFFCPTPLAARPRFSLESRSPSLISCCGPIESRSPLY